jgi:hypothetical protein
MKQADRSAKSIAEDVNLLCLVRFDVLIPDSQRSSETSEECYFYAFLARGTENGLYNLYVFTTLRKFTFQKY